MVKISQPEQHVRRQEEAKPVAKATCATDVEMTATDTGLGADAARTAAMEAARAAATGACAGKTCVPGICSYFEKKITGTVVRIMPPPAVGEPTHSATVTTIGACQCG